MTKKMRLMFLIFLSASASLSRAATIEFVSDNIANDASWITLLENAGHTVNAVSANYQTLDETKIAALNAADLVIVSRESNSGDYINDTEIADWNAITTTTILQNNYLIRNSRWNWEPSNSLNNNQTGLLEATDPTHPVFWKIPLDDNNQLDILMAGQNNDLASIGIGDNTNATVLATIAGSTSICYLAMWDAGTPFYTDGPVPAGNRIWFGLGNQGQTDNMTLNDIGQQLYMNVISVALGQGPGKAHSPNPANGNLAVDSQAYLDGVSWTAPEDPNFTVTGYDVWWSIGTEPNYITDMPATSNQAGTTFDPAVDITYSQTYYWRVDTHVTWDSDKITGNLNDTFIGNQWSFTTQSKDTTPTANAGADVITALPLMPATISGTVNDNGEGDIEDAGIAWSVISSPGIPTPEAMQMQDRSLLLANINTTDPNLWVDFIGTDTRQPGNPLSLTLGGLPAGTYTWKSYHHDISNQTGVFDVTIVDANGSTVYFNNPISDFTLDGVSEVSDISTFEAPIVSDGSDVTLIFDQQYLDSDFVTLRFFVMNGFELSNGTDTMKVDFSALPTDGASAIVASGWEGYLASNEVPETFTTQSYSAFGSSVTLKPQWGLDKVDMIHTAITNTTIDNLNPTASLVTDVAGVYSVQLTVIDRAGKSSSDTMTVTVEANACDAAVTAGIAFNYYDITGPEGTPDCIVNLMDFAEFAMAWMDDISLTEQK